LSVPGVLPDDRVVHRLAGGLVPHQRGLTLIGDPDRGDVADVHLGETGLHDFLCACPDLERIVLHPARLREDLLVLLLIDTDDLAAVIEDHEPGAGGALINRCCVFRHAYFPFAHISRS